MKLSDFNLSDYLPKIKKMANRMRFRLPYGMDIEDLVGYGYIGLVEAWSRYDSERQANFMAYAHRRVWGAMMTAIRQWSGMRPYRSKFKDIKLEIIHYGLNADIYSNEGFEGEEQD